MKYYLLFFLFLPVTCLAQIRITGKVINAADNKPVNNASVFLSNATVGGKTADDGSFTLVNVKPGQYEFVVSVVGYDTHRQMVMAGNENISLPDIKLSAKTTELKEVTVVGNNDWEKNFEMFKSDFIGTSAAAQECKITNYDALTLDYDKNTRKLTGSSNDFLEIENKYLGYKIKYLLQAFDKDNRTGMLYFAGSSLFEDLPGSLSQKRRWQKRRKQTYIGSSMHFLRSVLANSMDVEGFSVMRLIRKPNPGYKEGSLDAKYIQTLLKTPLLNVPDFFRQTDRDGLYALAFNDCLYIKHRSSNLATIVNINGPYAFFDHNGIIDDPAAVVFEGGWGRYRIAELLPLDYEPGE